MLQMCQPFLVLLTGNDFFNPLYMYFQSLGMAAAEQRVAIINSIDQSLSLLNTWLHLLLSVLKHYNKGNFVDGIKYFAKQNAYSLVLRSALMLVAHSRVVNNSDASGT